MSSFGQGRGGSGGAFVGSSCRGRGSGARFGGSRGGGRSSEGHNGGREGHNNSNNSRGRRGFGSSREGWRSSEGYNEGTGGGNNSSRNHKSGAHEEQNNFRKNKPIFGFTRLYGFLTQDEADAVIMSIGRNIPEWVQLIESVGGKGDEDDLFPLILHILAQKVCIPETILASNQIPIIMGSLNDHFDKNLRKLYGPMFMGEPVARVKLNGMNVDKSRMGILRSVHTIFAFALLRCQLLAADYIQELTPFAIGVLGTMTAVSSHDIPLTEIHELQQNFVQMHEIIKSLKQTEAEKEVKKRSNRYRYDLTEKEEASLHEMTPPEDFRDIPIVPTIEELLSLEDPFLRTNKTTGGYTDANHYLDVQYRLLREDFVRPLKQGIHEFKKNEQAYVTKKKKFPMGSNVRIYHDVRIETVDLILDNLVYSVKLPESVGSIKWDKSKRLLNGSLLVFTPDNFKSAYFAVVAKRDIAQLNKNRILGITWDGDMPVTDMHNNFLMLECEVYFEAYRHTLQALKTIHLHDFPMAKFIVEASDAVFAPKYLEDSMEQMRINDRYFSPLLGPWPTAKQLNLDENQFQAFKAALTKEFSIIQGPPGTGKTYLGLRVAETFLTNLNSWWKDGVCPILVVCYTNHALDQFLEGIANVFKRIDPDSDPAIVRVGGRSKCEALEGFNLAKRRILAGKKGLYSPGYWATKSHAKSAVQDLEEQRNTLMSEAIGLGNVEGLVDFGSLKCNMALRLEVSNEVMEVVIDPRWIKIDSDGGIFYWPDFSANNLLRKWFPRWQSAHTQQGPVFRQNVSFTPHPEVSLPATQPQENDDEDYDLEELLANRLVDDDDDDVGTDVLQRELEISILNHQTRTLAAVRYLPGLHSVSNCQEKVAELEHRKQKLSQPPAFGTVAMTPKQLLLETERINLELTGAKNRMMLLEILMTQHREGHLHLPNMKAYIEKTSTLTIDQLNRLTIPEKWGIYFAVVDKARQLTIQLTTKIREELVGAHRNLQNIQRVGDGQILRQAKVVGLTTTGAAKNHDLLQMMKSKIVIVEEAAEVLEAHIVTCITDHCQQLILIGDHQQLRPSTTVYDLSIKYHLDISLFERMLNNNLNCYRLGEQHRMRPEIADLVVGTIYKELMNHPSVNDYPEVKGLTKNLFFIDHEEHEKAETDSMSKSNTHEAEFLAQLCLYLILQGYKPSEITVLTTYTGQMFLLKKEISKFSLCHGVRVTVVDNYQGEECEIILLSLVRSNDKNNIGFLKTDNRICVAISRAKHGLYICGNMNNLTAKSETWRLIKKKLLAREEIGEELKLFCQIHATTSLVRKREDFKMKAPEGGCALLCNEKLPCSHKCEQVCHTMDREHVIYRCRKPCMKVCKNSHPCIESCYSMCPPCKVIMDKNLPCQHIKKLYCHVDETSIKCMEFVVKKLPCGHDERMACHNNPSNVKCRVLVQKVLPCTHIKTVECHINAEDIQCKQLVTKTLIPCEHEQIEECRKHPEMIKCNTDVEKEFLDCKHKLTVKCKDKNSVTTVCMAPCPFRLECGHQCTRLCHVNDDPDHIGYQCKKNCGRDCENGHPCNTQHKCFMQPCPPCNVQMEKTLSCTVHRKTLPCHVNVGSVVCENPCTRTVPNCGHDCLKDCHEECNPCKTPVIKTSPCGHPQLTECGKIPSRDRCFQLVAPAKLSACNHDGVKVPCKIRLTITPNEIANYCKHSCGYQLHQDANGKGCSHQCKGNCSECRQGRIHKKCQEKCERELVCGHVCAAPCAASCPPCQKQCFMKCDHSVCKSKCGEPCSDCTEKCTWICDHKECTQLCGRNCDRTPCNEPCPKILKCDHPCIGFCGEPCPPHCRICNRDELTEFQLYGFEEDEDARFVYLEDCKHSIEENGLTHYMNMEVEEGSIGAKTCPKCKTVIRHCRRYGNILRNRLKDVMAVKKIVYGNQELVRIKQENMVKEIREKKKHWITTILEISPESVKFVLDKLIQSLPPNPRRREIDFKFLKVPERVMQSLELIVQHFMDAHEVIAKTLEFGPDLRGSLIRKYTRLFAKLMEREPPFTKTEVDNFDREFERLHDFAQLYKRRALPAFTNALAVATPIYQRAVNLAGTPRPYSKEIKTRLFELIKELDDKLRTGLGITDREKREILAAMQLSRGHWYKCPNGHIYAIGECGGPNQHSRCNECGAAIGGESHRLTSGNLVASEMDGAT